LGALVRSTPAKVCDSGGPPLIGLNKNEEQQEHGDR
jgi:hypothetical protein